MTEPRRLLEEGGSDFERSLLEAGSSYRASTAARTRTLAALGIAGTAVLTTGTAGGASSVLLGKVGWTKVLAISGLGVAAAVPIGNYVYQSTQPTEPPAVVANAAPSARPMLPVAAPVAKAAVPEATTQVPVAPSTAARLEPRAPAVSVLTAELGALDAARARLAAGDGAAALALLDDYSRTYPRGRLVLEAEVLRIDALAKSGQMVAAKKRAEAFLKRHPKSVLASRVRTYLTD